MKPTLDQSGELSNAISVHLLRAIYQYSPDAIVIVDGEGLIVSVNERCKTLLGYDPDELIGQAVEILVPPDVTNHVELRYQFEPNGIAKSRSTRPVLRAQHKSGQTVSVDISLSPLPPIQGYEGLVEAAIREFVPRADAQNNLHLQSVAMDAAANGIVITDIDGVIQWVNPAVSKMTGYAYNELVGQHSRLLKSGQHDEAFYQDLWRTIIAGDTWFGDIVNRRKDGTIYYEEQHIAPVRDDAGDLTHFIAIKQDVTARKQAEWELQKANDELTRQLAQIEALQQKLREQAIRDPLTNLFNRRYLEESLKREIARVKRSGIELCVISIDIDEFKQLNDMAGHASGDAVLKMLSNTIMSHTRECDIACRLGGDEFLIVLPDISLERTQMRAEELRAVFEQNQRDHSTSSPVPVVSLSMGVAHLQPQETADRLLSRVDQALYEAKHRGRDQVVIED